MIKKILISLILLFIIIFSFSYTIFIYSFNIAPEENLINQSLRQKVIRNYWLKEFLRLNRAGDARWEYKNSERIKINVIYQPGQNLLPETLIAVSNAIKSVAGEKEIVVDEFEQGMSIGGQTNDEELKQLAKNTPLDWQLFDKTAVLQIFLLNKYEQVPSYVGLVEDSHNIFLFMETIKEVSDQQPSTFAVEVSTILHEFAHLLGAEHVDADDCILNEKVENISHGLSANIRTDFCPEDLDMINSVLD